MSLQFHINFLCRLGLHTKYREVRREVPKGGLDDVGIFVYDECVWCYHPRGGHYI